MPHLPKEVRCFFVCASCTLTSERGRSRLVWGSCSAFYTYFRLIVLRESGAAAAKRLHRKAPVYPLKSWKKRQKQVVLCGRRLLLPLNHTSGINFANAEILTDSPFGCGNVSWSCSFCSISLLSVLVSKSSLSSSLKKKKIFIIPFVKYLLPAYEVPGFILREVVNKIIQSL